MNRKVKNLLSCMLTIIIVMNSTTVVKAKYCLHRFDGHREICAGYTERLQPCEDGEPGCKTYDCYYYCQRECLDCGAVIEDKFQKQPHDHFKGRYHTKYHVKCSDTRN